jgi:hypothetical protein
MWPYPRKIASCVCPFFIAFCRLQYREPIRRLTIYLVQPQIPAYRLKWNCRCMQWRKVVLSPRYRGYINVFHYVIGENSKILLVEFSLWIWQGKRKAKATVFWVLVDVNLRALFAPGTNCLRIKKIVNFCTRIKIFALLPLLTIWGSQSQTAQYRQSDWWYPKQWLMKWFSNEIRAANEQ